MGSIWSENSIEGIGVDSVGLMTVMDKGNEGVAFWTLLAFFGLGVEKEAFFAGDTLFTIEEWFFHGAWDNAWIRGIVRNILIFWNDDAAESFGVDGAGHLNALLPICQWF